MLLKYTNRIVLLSIVDWIALGLKTYWGVLTLHASVSSPKRLRRNFTQYYLTSVTYYTATLLKYVLIEIAFLTGLSKVQCYYTFLLMCASAVGCLIFAPCMWRAMQEVDKRHVWLTEAH